MTEDRALRLITCEPCERKDRMLAAITLDLENAEVSLRAERRKNKRLQAELDGKRKASPLYQDAEALFDFWRSETGHTKAKFLEGRQKALFWALKHYSKRQVAYAIRGCAKLGFIDPVTKERRDALTLICRDDENLEKNLNRYAVWCQQQNKPVPDDLWGEPEPEGDRKGEVVASPQEPSTGLEKQAEAS